MRKFRTRQAKEARTGAGTGPDALDQRVHAEALLIERIFECEGEKNSELRQLALQYLRIKCAVFRLIVHPAGENGLERFLTHFTQIKVYEPDAGRMHVDSVVAPGLDLRSTEYRVSPDAWLEWLRPQQRMRKPPHDAWLIHFQRSRPKERLPRYGGTVRAIEGEARRIGDALAQCRRRLEDLRGLDLCGVEGHQPLWVSTETLKKLRGRASEIANKTPPKVQPLYLTLHAGEDYVWLTSGLRAMAEPFVWQLVRRGDRIGHGIALTLDPAAWRTRRLGQVKQVTRFDRLQDLAFLARYTQPWPGPADQSELQLPASAGRERRTEREERWLKGAIEALARDVGLVDATEPIATACELWVSLGGRLTRRFMNGRTLLPEDAPVHHRWLHSYLWTRSIQRKADEKVNLSIEAGDNPEFTLVEKARHALIREVARWQVPIESNPSSNLIVGSLDAIASQDFLAQSSQQVREFGHETPAWTISTDDPITFQTSLSDEYAYAWAGMVLRATDPYDPAHARALLEEAAATSMRTRFAHRP